jgi:hypothetical protein
MIVDFAVAMVSLAAFAIGFMAGRDSAQFYRKEK